MTLDSMYYVPVLCIDAFEILKDKRGPSATRGPVIFRPPRPPACSKRRRDGSLSLTNSQNLNTAVQVGILHASIR